MTDFEIWWYNEGSDLAPIDGEDKETHTKRVCRIAWENGAYKAFPTRKGEIV